MIINRLTKNFSFIENKEFQFYNKEKLIDYLEKVENHNNDFEGSITNIRKILELVVQDIFHHNKYIIDDEKKWTLSKKLSHIKDYWISEEKIISSMYRINDMGNEAAHPTHSSFRIKNKIDENDFYNTIKCLYVILINLYDDVISKFTNNNYSLDTSIYKSKINNISNSSIKIDDENIEIDSTIKQLDKEIPDFKIESKPLLYWIKYENVRFNIPIYQREYKWSKKNITFLLNDILERTEDKCDHYFGVLAIRKEMINNFFEVKIIDGQQRITSSIIILAAIRDYSINRFKTYEKIPFLKDIFDQKKDWEWFFKNPGGTAVNNISFRNILNGIKNDSNYSKTRANENFLFALNWFEEKNFSEEKIINFTQTFLLNFKFGSINFNNSTYKRKNEMELFENLNSKGLSLDVVDLVKTHIFMLNTNNLLEEKERNIVSKYNSIIEESKLKDLVNFYKTMSEMIEGKSVPKDEIEEYKRFKKVINFCFENREEIFELKEFENHMDNLLNFMLLYSEAEDKKNLESKHFTNLIQIEDIVSVISSDNKKRKLFVYLYYSFYIILKKSFPNQQIQLRSKIKNIRLRVDELENIRKVFIETLKLIIKNKIIVQASTNELREFFFGASNKAYKEIQNGKINTINELCEFWLNEFKVTSKNKENLFGFNNFVSSLNNSFSSTDKILELLKLTEIIMNNPNFEKSQDWIERKSNTIEHIAPRENSEWLSLIPDTEKEKWNSRYFENNNKIGNFLILDRRLNSKISNKIFLEKKKYFDGIISPLYKNLNNDDIDISRKKSWNPENIERRTFALIEFIINFVIKE